MTKIFSMALGAALLALAGLSPAKAADVGYEREVQVPRGPEPVGGVKIGYLDCAVGGGIGYILGSSKEVECVFRPAGGGGFSERYAGQIRKLGVDVGFTARSRLLWAVFAPTAGYHRGSLGGIYEGASAEATVGAGIGANLLVGGTSGSIHLQVISVTGQLGLNVAAAGTSMTLTATN